MSWMTVTSDSQRPEIGSTPEQVNDIVIPIEMDSMGAPAADGHLRHRGAFD